MSNENNQSKPTPPVAAAAAERGHRRLWDLTRGERLRYGAAVASMTLGVMLTLIVPVVWLGAIDAIAGQLGAPGGDGPAATSPQSQDAQGPDRQGGDAQGGDAQGRDAQGRDAQGRDARGQGVQGLSGNRSQPVEAWFADLAAERGLRNTLLIAAGLGVLLTVLAGACHYLRGRWSAQSAERIVRRLRERLYGHLSELPCRELERLDTGDLVQRCTSDVETVKTFLSVQVVEIGRAALLLLCVLPLLVWLHPLMAAVSLALFPFIIALAVVFFRRIKTAFQAADEAEARMTSVLQENLTGIRVVRAFARQEFEQDKFAAANAEHRDLTARLIRLLGDYWAVSDGLCFMQLGAVFLTGGWLMSRGALSLGEFVAFQVLVTMVIWPVRQLGRLLTDSGKAVVSLGRLEEVLRIPEEDDGTQGQVAPPSVPLHGELELAGLGFAFEAQDEPVLDDVSLRVEPGQTLALLGPPGSGKSVLIQLLLRLYDGYAGSIRLDGRELSTLPRKDVRAQIGAVLAEPFLYSRTIADNVRVGWADAPEDALHQATSSAAIHEAVVGFRDGYETLVGERGVTLSGGQRQRLALARALLKDPAILVLDDALSAVDTHTEAHILEALRARRGRRTTIIISHRLSSVVHADQIVVLERGRVVQAGTHAELTAREGPYERLWRIQGALEATIGETA